MLPSLPNEVWFMIAEYLPHLPDEPLWRPWQSYRNVCKMFRIAIERHYLETILPATVLTANFEPGSPQYTTGYSPLAACFRFNGFADKAKQLAILRLASEPPPAFQFNMGPQTTMLLPPGEAEKEAFKFTLIKRIIKTRQSSHPGLNPHECMILAYDQPDINLRCITDLLPPDLMFDHTEVSYIFDWRAYFSTVLWERRTKPRRWSAFTPQERVGYQPIRFCIRNGNKQMLRYIFEAPRLAKAEEEGSSKQMDNDTVMGGT